MTDCKQRVILSALLWTTSIIGLCWVFKNHTTIIYTQAHGNYLDLWRLIWMIPFISLSLAIRAFLRRQEPGSPWIAYLKYVFYLFIACSILFVMCHSFLDLGNWLYYPVTAIGVATFALPSGLPDKMSAFFRKFYGLND